ncbi:MAG: hypothetical protein ACI9HU_000245 [Colwellia sp.]|jgi:hypothetical protein
MALNKIIGGPKGIYNFEVTDNINSLLDSGLTLPSLASAIAFVESGGLSVGGAISTIEYHAGTGIGGGSYRLVDAGSSDARPIDDGGSVNHAKGGSGGLYLKGLFVNDVVTLENFGYNPTLNASDFITPARDYLSSLSVGLNAIKSLTLAGEYVFNTKYILTGALHLKSLNATIKTANDDFAIQVGVTAGSAGFLNTDGTLNFTNDGASVGGGFLGEHGSIVATSLIAQDLEGRVLDCLTTQNKINNSSVNFIKCTNSGGVRLEVTGTRGSMEIEVVVYHSSNSKTESLIVKNTTDSAVVNAVCDTESGLGLNAISIDNVSGCSFGTLWGTSPDARGCVISGNSFTGSNANYLNHFNSIGSTDSALPISIDAKLCRFDFIRVTRSKAGSVIFGVNAGQLSVGLIAISDGSSVTGSTSLVIDSVQPIDIQTIAADSATDLAAIKMAGGNKTTIGTIQSSQALGTASNVVWETGSRPQSLINCQDPDYIFKGSSNNTVITATSSFFNVPHGLSATPTIYNVNARNGTSAIITTTANASNIQVTFAANQANPQFSWSAQLF